MKIISFVDIQDFLISEIKKHSIDEIYHKSHPWYNNMDKFDCQNEVIKKSKNNLVLRSIEVIHEIQQVFNFGYMGFRFSDFKSKFFRSNDTIQDYSKASFEFFQKITQRLDKEYGSLEEMKNALMQIKDEEITLSINKQSYKIEKLINWGNVNKFKIDDSFTNENFKRWIEYNYFLLNNLETVKNEKVKQIENNVNEILNQINNFKKSKKIKETKIKKTVNTILTVNEEIRLKLPELTKRKKKKLNKYKNEISQILRLKDNEFYSKRIKELEVNIKQIPEEITKYEKDLKLKKEKEESSLKKLKDEIKKINERIVIQENDFKKNNKELKEVKKYKHKFPILKEFFAKENIEFLFIVKPEIIKNKIFKLAYKRSHDNIAFNQIKKELLNTINNKIKEILVLERERFNTPSIIDSYNGDISNIASSYISLRLALNIQNYIQTSDGIVYLSLGNGIIAEIKARKNYKNFSPLVAEIQDNGKNYFTSYLFSGYTNSGFLLNKGLYIVSKNVIFEILYKTSPLLLSGIVNFMNVQNISDSKKKDEELEDEM